MDKIWYISNTQAIFLMQENINASAAAHDNFEPVILSKLAICKNYNYSILVLSLYQNEMNHKKQ